MDQIFSTVDGPQASGSVKLYCLYMYYFVGLCVASLATYFNKNPKTIKRWIDKYDSGDGVSRQINTDTVRRKFNIQQVDWVCALIDEHPLLYLDELQKHLHTC